MRKLTLFLGAGLFLLSVICFTSRTDTEAAKQTAVTVNVADYTLDGTTVLVHTKDDDIYVGQRIEAALDYAKEHATDAQPITVKVPAGKYVFHQDKAVMYHESGYDEPAVFRCLHLYSNTILDVRGCTFRMANNQKYLERYFEFGNQSTLGELISYKGVKDYNSSKACAGYKGFRNIAVLGGKWIGNKQYYEHTTFKLYHADNVMLSGMDILGGAPQHQMEVAGVNHLLITDCKFRDYYPRTPGLSNEALQLDIPCNRRMMKTGYEDGTPNQNITITGCTFSGVPSGVGTHSVLYGAYHKNISITNNTFTNIKETAIDGLAYENVEISGNRMTNVANGISMRSFNDPESEGLNTVCMMTFGGERMAKGSRSFDGGITISDNRIAVKKGGYAISVHGTIVSKKAKSLEGKRVPSGNYYMNHVTISGNQVSSKGRGIDIYDTLDAKVLDNTLTGRVAKGSIALSLERCQVQVSRNSFKDWKHAIHATNRARGTVSENNFDHVSKSIYAKESNDLKVE